MKKKQNRMRTRKDLYHFDLLVGMVIPSGMQCSGKITLTRVLNGPPVTWKGTPTWKEPSLNNHQEPIAKCLNCIRDFLSCISFHLHKRCYEGAIIILTILEVGKLKSRKFQSLPQSYRTIRGTGDWRFKFRVTARLCRVVQPCYVCSGQNTPVGILTSAHVLMVERLIRTAWRSISAHKRKHVWGVN